MDEVLDHDFVVVDELGGLNLSQLNNSLRTRSLLTNNAGVVQEQETLRLHHFTKLVTGTHRCVSAWTVFVELYVHHSPPSIVGRFALAFRIAALVPFAVL